MRLLCLILVLAPWNLVAQERPSYPQIRIAFPEAEEADGSKTVVHFVTNRLLVGAKDGEPKWNTLVPYRKFLQATSHPLVGCTVVKHDGSLDKENDANLEPYSIERFHPLYKVGVRIDDDSFPGIYNDVADTGLSFLANYWKKNVLIYVHGFNNDWPTAIKRAAQLKRDLKKRYKEDFAIVVYSWPSLGGGGPFGVIAYTDDERRYKQTLPAFAQFLETILLKDGGTKGRGKRWVLAHSMGNRVFLHGLAQLGRQKDAAKQILPPDLFTRIVLAAPDMEVDDFKTHTQYAHQFCSNPRPLMYFHAASNIAVNVSEFQHSDTRAGVAQVTSEFLFSIDAKAAKSPWTELGHGYYASNDKMVDLIAGYFFADLDPSKSANVERAEGGKYRLK